MTVATPRSPFREPTRGSGSRAAYVVRYLLGLVALLVGAWLVLAAATDSFRVSLPLLAAPLVGGAILWIGGWFVLPGRPGRAAAAAGLAVAGTLLVVLAMPRPYPYYYPPHPVGALWDPLVRANGLGGPAVAAVIALGVTAVLAAWLVVRRRSPLALVLLPIPFLVTLLLYAPYRWWAIGSGIPELFEPLVTAIQTARVPIPVIVIFADWGRFVATALLLTALVALVSAAWAARALAPVMRGADPEVRAQRLAAQQAAWAAHLQAQRQAQAAAAAAAAAADAAWRVAEIKRWEDAYAAAHDGERPPPGWSPPAATPPPPGWQPPPVPPTG